MKVEVAVLGSPSLIVLMVSVEVKQSSPNQQKAEQALCKPLPTGQNPRLTAPCSSIYRLNVTNDKPNPSAKTLLL